jgi:hypothetical protein
MDAKILSRFLTGVLKIIFDSLFDQQSMHSIVAQATSTISKALMQARHQGPDNPTFKYNNN